jgi:hypothetical protein
MKPSFTARRSFAAAAVVVVASTVVAGAVVVAGTVVAAAVVVVVTVVVSAALVDFAEPHAARNAAAADVVPARWRNSRLFIPSKVRNGCITLISVKPTIGYNVLTGNGICCEEARVRCHLLRWAHVLGHRRST